MSRVIGLLLALSLLLTGTVQAVSGALSLEHTEGKGLGYQRGYSTLGLFLSEPLQEDLYAILELREHLFNNGKGAFNFGIGLRTDSDSLGGMLGINSYYDYLQSNRHGLHQVGCGLEYLSDLFDIRLNGYFPVGDRKNVIGVHRFTYPGGYYAVCSTYKEALSGCDGEVGLSIYQNCWFGFYGALGSYYYHRPIEKEIYGGRGRLLLDLGRYVSLEARATRDRVYKTCVQGVISLTIPFGSCCCERIQPVRRNEIITRNTLNCGWKTNY